MLYEMRADERIERLVVAEGDEHVVVFATIRVPELGDADASSVTSRSTCACGRRSASGR